jgi:ubiquinone/menaquinone biosynthesis C-methylase UbiE
MRPGTFLRWHALKNILKIEIKSGSIILDMGSFDGFISYNIMRIIPNLKIVAMDIDKSGLQVAKERGLNTLYGSAIELPIKDNQIDVVLCLDLIEHIKEDDNLFKEIFRITKKDGKVILTTPMQDGVSFPFLNRDKIKAINKNWGHVRNGYSLKQIIDIFQSNGLKCEKLGECFNLLSRLAYRFAIISKLPLKGKQLIYRSIVKLEPFLKYGAQEHIIVGKKL